MSYIERSLVHEFCQFALTMNSSIRSLTLNGMSALIDLYFAAIGMEFVVPKEGP